MNKIRIIIADDVEEIRNVIKKFLAMEVDSYEIVGEAGNGQEVLRLLETVKADIVLMDINMPVLNGLETTEKITEKYPNMIVVIMSVQSENEYLKKAMFHGAKEYIIKPFNYDMLIDTIRITYEKYKERQATPLDSNGGSAANRTPKKLAMFSSKGGTGKTLIALNLAVLLSRQKGKRVLLLDLDLISGDIGIMVNQYRHKTIMDVIEDGLTDTYEGIQQCLLHYNENLDVLLAPEKPEAAEYIGKDSVEKLIKTVEHYYDYILMDTGTNFNDITLFALDSADKVILVTTNDIVSLKSAKISLGVMQSLGYEVVKTAIVINRFCTEYGISKGEVVAAFDGLIAGMLPEDSKAAMLSVNKGLPLCEDLKFAKSKLTKALESLPKELAI